MRYPAVYRGMSAVARLRGGEVCGFLVVPPVFKIGEAE